MAQVLLPRRKESGLDALAKALNVASGALNISSALDKQELLGLQKESTQLDLAEKKAASEGRLTPLAQRKLEASGYKEIKPEELQRLGPMQQKTMGIVNLKRVNEEGVESPAIFAKIQKDKTQRQLSPLEMQEKQASIAAKQASTKKSLAEAKFIETGAPKPQEVRKDQKFIAQQFEKSNIPSLTKQLEKIDDYLVNKIGITSGVDAIDLKKDVPGFGATSVLPDLALTREGKELRQLVQGLENQVLKMRSGGAVTPQEAARLIKEIKGAGTDEQLLTGLKNFRDTIQSSIENTFAGVSEEGVASYKQRGKVSLEMPLFNRALTPEMRVADQNKKPGPSGTQLPALDILNKIESEETSVGIR